MDSQIKKIAPEIKSAIEESKNILLHLHPGPDGDSVGSSLAWMYILKSMGKNVTVISGDDNPPKYLFFLPGFDEIEVKSFLEVDQSKFDLFIINDSADLGRVSSKGDVKFAKNLKTIMIDHHVTNPGFGDIQLLVPCVANCEILFYLFQELGFEITKEMASCLFMGIYTDSGFKYSGTDQKTFVAAGELVKINPEFWKDVFELENNRQPIEIVIEGLLLDSIETYFKDRIAISAVSYDAMVSKKIAPDEVHGGLITNKLKSVIGWEIGITMVEKFQKKVMVSMRTRDAEKYDVSKIAVELGGGGHKAAAGAKIDAPLAEAKRILLSAISKVYPEFGK